MSEGGVTTGGNEDHDKEILLGRIRDLEKALGQHNDHLANTFKLTPSLTNLLGLLLALPTVNAELIHQRLNIASDAKVAIHRLRNELKQWDIPVQSKRMLGYWLDPRSKERIKALIEGKPLSEVCNSPAAPDGETAGEGANDRLEEAA